MTDGYEHLESIFGIKMGIHDPIDADAISRPGNKIIRPRVDKSKEEQRQACHGERTGRSRFEVEKEVHRIPHQADGVNNHV